MAFGVGVACGQTVDGFLTGSDPAAGQYVAGAAASGTTNGGSGWATTSWSSAGARHLFGRASGLTYETGGRRLVTTAGAIESLSGSGAAEYRRDFTAPAAGSDFWLSFLVDRDAIGAGYEDRFELRLTSATNDVKYAIRAVDNSQLWHASYKPLGGSAVIEPIPGAAYDAPTFFVVQITKVGQADSVMNVWVNPADFNNLGAPTYTSGDFAGSGENFSRIALVTDGGRTGIFDEIRMGASLAQVLPHEAVPVPPPEPAWLYEGFQTGSGAAGGYYVRDAAGAATANAGIGWTTPSWTSAGTRDLLGSASRPGYTDGAGNRLETTPGALASGSGSGLAEYRRDLPQPTAGSTVWFSFFMDRDPIDPGFEDRFAIRLMSATNDVKYEFGAKDGSTQWHVSYKPSGGTLTASAIPGTDYAAPTFFIGRITKIGQSGSVLDVWVNPPDLTNLDAPGTTRFTSPAFTSQNFARIGLIADGTRVGLFDEIRVGTSLGSVAPLATTPPETPVAGGTPNILFICVDDLMPRTGSYGHPEMVTPRMDTLASQGVQFNRAYVQQAICSPSRVNLLTGLRPDTTRIYDIGTDFRSTVPWVTTLPEFLKSRGYHTTALGKVYHTATDYDNARSWSPSDPASGGQGPDYVNPDSLAAEGTHGRGPAYESGESGGASVADDAYIDGKNTKDAIRRLAHLKYKQPFFFAVGLSRPHLPFSAPKHYWDLYPASVIDAALPARNTPADNTSHWSYTESGELRQYYGVPASGSGTPIYSDPALVRNLVHGYYAGVSYSDKLVGDLLDALAAEGLADNTIIVLWGDHGFHLGEQNQWTKHTNFERATRIPLIIKAPGTASGQQSNAIVETVDIYPTLLDLCGFQPPAWLEGQSFKSALLNPATAPGRPNALSQYPRFTYERGADGVKYALNVMGYTLVTSSNFRYTEWRRQDSNQVMARELYNHATDPDENSNIANEPANAGLVAALAAALEARIAESKPASGGAAFDVTVNGGFDSGSGGLANWSLVTSDGASVTPSQVSGESAPGAEPALFLDVASPGNSADDTRLSQTATIKPNRIYTLRFRARASADKTLQVRWANGATTYFQKDFPVGTTAADFEVSGFVPDNVTATDPAAVLAFHLGGSAADLWLDSVELLQQSAMVLAFQEYGMAGTSPTEDSDGDTVSQLAEYASNMNPALADLRPLNPASPSAGLPTGDINSGGDRLRLHYLRRRDAADLLYHAEFSSDLGVTDPWAPDGASEAVTPIDDDWEMVTVEDSLDASPKRFGRLRFQYNP